MPKRSELDERLAFLSLGEGDRDALRVLKAIVERHADTLVSTFYRHLLSFPQTRALLADPEVKGRLFEKQRAYLRSLAEPSLDEDYARDRLRIGETHERIGLEPRWYLSAYAIQFAMLVPHLCEHLRGEERRLERALIAVFKLLLLDAQIAVDAYVQRRERELEYLNQELAEAGQALEREYRKQQRELRRTTERARAAEELASAATLVAGLAHEIGTPMNVIQGHAELLEGAVSDERARWRLQTIREQIERISNIIQALLNIARPRPPARAPVQIREILDTTLRFLGEKLERRRIELERSFSPVPEIRGDAEKLQQLFLNLFLNGIDAMPDGGKLTVRLSTFGDEAIYIRVRDTGAGIPEERLARVFDPFYTTKPAGQGSGLGLVVAKGIVLDHNGTIDVSSGVGEGTEFRVLLPLEEPQSETPTNSGA